MSSLFQNLTARSAGDLLADLAACRQLRHLTDADREMVAKEVFAPNRAQYMPPKMTKLGQICSQCKRPKSDNATIHGLCQACYRNNAVERVVWMSDAFQVAMKHYGYSCDCCATVVEVSDEDARRAGDRALENLDGKSKLMLCKKCNTRFKAFATREFDREVRTRFDSELEKIMVAFVAQTVLTEADRVRRSHYV